MIRERLYNPRGDFNRPGRWLQGALTGAGALARVRPAAELFSSRMVNAPTGHDFATAELGTGSTFSKGRSSAAKRYFVVRRAAEEIASFPKAR
jgi:hypothetical protein